MISYPELTGRTWAECGIKDPTVQAAILAHLDLEVPTEMRLLGGPLAVGDPTREFYPERELTLKITLGTYRAAPAVLLEGYVANILLIK